MDNRCNCNKTVVDLYRYDYDHASGADFTTQVQKECAGKKGTDSINCVNNVRKRMGLKATKRKGGLLETAKKSGKWMLTTGLPLGAVSVLTGGAATGLFAAKGAAAAGAAKGAAAAGATKGAAAAGAAKGAAAAGGLKKVVNKVKDVTKKVKPLVPEVKKVIKSIKPSTLPSTVSQTDSQTEQDSNEVKEKSFFEDPLIIGGIAAVLFIILNNK